jgi:D-lactate dehydrogenase (cytochrome)
MARVELLDEMQVRVCNAYSKLGLPEQPMLFVEFHGSEAGVAEQATRFGEIVGEYGSDGFEWTKAPESRTRLWQARHDVFWAVTSYRPGAKVVVTDVCVPISRLAECVAAAKQEIQRAGLIAPIVGHVGDGNFHAGVMVMMDDADEAARAKVFIERLAELAIAADGTCTGEHGIGEGKKHFLAPEYGEAAVGMMRTLKRAFDPDSIMNPGKVI